ncbi:MAG TPA: DUF368 domain-containing protein [Bacteroidales bacterium]|nr:DUF368 domain-containing protein [Bacteroidales bacterium]HOL97225.1 DUF368 domain-containing protein [Bacteroidales bacterium]HOM35517.1 DUF368 domain-containing protein [Bacteroidales bacterium]HPD23862.1 DUF368 domain-containing protein [Bacteroidales bacterium]HRS98786.1 DUF368 domain-containing protein [Bacteroidales bacterium]
MIVKEYLFNFLKGIAMGIANVIPGVSGGTIALITGIFERLINSLKSFNLTAAKLLFKFKISDFIKHTDLYFLLSVLLGTFTAIFSIAKLFEYLFENYPVYIWAFFFGLVLASLYFVNKQISKFSIPVILFFLAGSIIAISISILSPAGENQSIFYLFICGIVASCSMILPGLSGSFVLVLMGNYQLVMVHAVSNFDLKILIPIGFGAMIGLIGFSYILSYLFKKYKDITIALLSGFVTGSLLILWPWKLMITENFGGKEKLVAYEWFLPQIDTEFFHALTFIILGVIVISFVELIAEKIK